MNHPFLIGLSALTVQRKNILRIMIPLLAMAAIGGALFRDCFSDGMHMDEVARPATAIQYCNPNAVPLKHSIYDIKFRRFVIPVVYKEYISSWITWLYTPMCFFWDYRIGVRVIHMVYFFLSVIGLFLILSKYDYWLSVFAALLMLAHPLLYPDMRFGFIATWHVPLIATAFHLYKKYFFDGKGRHNLFFGTFLLFFSANLMFYSIWVVAAFLAASAILFPGYWAKVFCSIKNIVLVLSASLIGLANLVIYNIACGFPTFMRLFNSIFNVREYNTNPIDYRKLGSFSDEFVKKAMRFHEILGSYGPIFLVESAVLLAGSVIAIVIALRKHEFGKNRILFFPAIMYFLIMLFIVVSPKAYNSWHWAYLIPLSILGIGCTARALANVLGANKAVLLTGYAVLTMLLIAYTGISLSKVQKYIRSGGTGLFSPALYTLADHFKSKHTPTGRITILQWGLYYPLYLLYRGELQSHDLTFPLYDRSDEQMDKALDLYFSTIVRPDAIYFPVYISFYSNQKKAFFRCMARNGGGLVENRTFYERDGTTPVIVLYSLTNTPVVRDNARNRIMQGAIDTKDITIHDFGPKIAQKDTIENGMNIWIKAHGCNADVIAVANQFPLETMVTSFGVTAKIPAGLLKHGSNNQIHIYDMIRRVRSSSITLEVR